MGVTRALITVNAKTGMSYINDISLAQQYITFLAETQKPNVPDEIDQRTAVIEAGMRVSRCLGTTTTPLAAAVTALRKLNSVVKKAKHDEFAAKPAEEARETDMPNRATDDEITTATSDTDSCATDLRPPDKMQVGAADRKGKLADPTMQTTGKKPVGTMAEADRAVHGKQRQQEKVGKGIVERGEKLNGKSEQQVKVGSGIAVYGKTGYTDEQQEAVKHYERVLAADVMAGRLSRLEAEESLSLIARQWGGRVAPLRWSSWWDGQQL